MKSSLARPLHAALIVAAAATPFAAAASDRCVADAAARHRLDSRLVASILEVARDQNLNIGEIDDAGAITLGEFGRMAPAQLASFGHSPQLARSPCLRAEMVSWVLATKIGREGSSWDTIGSLWSKTRYYSYRAQTLVYNQLVAAGAVAGPARRVPSMRPSESPWAPGVEELDVHVYIYSDSVK